MHTLYLVYVGGPVRLLNTRVRPSAARGQRTPATITRHGHMLSKQTRWCRSTWPSLCRSPPCSLRARSSPPPSSQVRPSVQIFKTRVLWRGFWGWGSVHVGPSIPCMYISHPPHQPTTPAKKQPGPNQLKIGSRMSPLVWTLIAVFFPIGYPISKARDHSGTLLPFLWLVGLGPSHPSVGFCTTPSF